MTAKQSEKIWLLFLCLNAQYVRQIGERRCRYLDKKKFITRKTKGKQCITALIPRFSFLALGFTTAFTFATMTVFAGEAATGGNIFDMAKTAMQKVYNDVIGIATMAAVVCAAVCLFLMYFSKNGRTVDESRAWLKRIIICWAILMTLGAIANYFEVLIPQNNYGG